jgi:NAD-dependent dihydropyrimidine dehydrogenase PreA subunit
MMAMGEEVYQELREFLDRMPAGFPATDIGVEIKILRKLFTPEDASMALCLTREREPAAVIARRCGMEEAEAAERLASMASRGLILRVREGDETLYQAEQFIVGIYEYQVARIDREFSELVEQYLPYLGLSWAAVKTGQMRTVPVASAVDATASIATYDRIRDLVRQQEIIGITECVCRKQQGLLGNRCDIPLELCMGFGKEMGDFYQENGWPVREVGVEEALSLLDRSEELGLVLRPDNAQDIRFVCSCCSCCCPGLRLIKVFPNPADFTHSNYRSVLDPDLCNACGNCVERCPMDAVTEGEDFMHIDPKRCIGCGVCLSTCPEDAISFVEREEVEVPPPDYKEALNRISMERGLI